MLHELASATGKRIVFYCAFGERSAMAVQAAQDAGIAIRLPHPWRPRCLAQGRRAADAVKIGERREPAMKLSARNVLKGRVASIDKGKVTAIVRVDIGGGNVVTSSITLAALEELKLKKGSDVHAIIKASEVLLGVDD